MLKHKIINSLGSQHVKLCFNIKSYEYEKCILQIDFIIFYMDYVYYFQTCNQIFSVTAIGNAFNVLSDPVKRKKYDTYGLDAVNASENHSFRQAHAAYGGTFEG